MPVSCSHAQMCAAALKAARVACCVQPQTTVMRICSCCMYLSSTHTASAHLCSCCNCCRLLLRPGWAARLCQRHHAVHRLGLLRVYKSQRISAGRQQQQAAPKVRPTQLATGGVLAYVKCCQLPAATGTSKTNPRGSQPQRSTTAHAYAICIPFTCGCTHSHPAMQPAAASTAVVKLLVSSKTPHNALPAAVLTCTGWQRLRMRPGGWLGLHSARLRGALSRTAAVLPCAS